MNADAQWNEVSAPLGPEMYLLLTRERDAPREAYVVGVAWGGLPPEAMDGEPGTDWIVPSEAPQGGWLLVALQFYETLRFYAEAARQAYAADPFTFSRSFLSACSAAGLQAHGAPEAASGHELARWWGELDPRDRDALLDAVEASPFTYLHVDVLVKLEVALYKEYYNASHGWEASPEWWDEPERLEPAIETELARELRAVYTAKAAL